MADVVVVGSINQDIVLQVEGFVRPGETIAGRDLRYAPGGKGANQAVAAARAGASTRLVGAVGEDAAGVELVAFLAGEGIDVEGVEVCSVATGAAFIQVDAAGENAIVVAGGANLQYRFPTEAPGLRRDDHVLATLEMPVEAILAAFRAARQVGARTVLNAAPAGAFPVDLLSLTDCLVVNETELAGAAEAFAGISVTDPSSRAAALRAFAGQGKLVVATLGSKGLLCRTPDEEFALAAHPVPVVDTTAAGDTFVGYLAAGLVSGLDLRSALASANAAAALAVGVAGAAISIPRVSAVRDLLPTA